MKIKISLITPTYNSSKFIRDNLESVRNQSYKNIEHIIVDSASTDGTLEILKKNNFNLNNLISEKDSGIYQGLNKGIRRSTGDIIGVLNSDDVFENNNVLAFIASKFLNQKIDAVYGNLYYVDKNNIKIVRKWKSSEFLKLNLEKGWMPPHPTLYIRKCRLDLNNLFNEKLKISSDYEMILRLFSQDSFNAMYIDKYIVRMRMGGISNNSVRNIIKKMYEDFQALEYLNLSIPQRLKCILNKNYTKLNQFTFT